MVLIVCVVVCSFQYLSGNDIWHITEGDFRLSCCARRFSLCIFSWEKSWIFCENWHLTPAVSESALRVSCRPSLLSMKTRVYCSSFFMVVCSFRSLFGNDIRHMTEGDFVYHTVQDVLACVLFLGRNRECLVRTVPATEFCEYPVPKHIGILLTYVSLIIMVRNCYAYFILYYAWRWIQNTAKLLN